MLARYARLIVDHHRAVLVVTLALTAALAFQIRHLVVGFDPESVFPSDDPAVVLDHRIRAEFGGRDFVAIAVVPRTGDVWQPAVLNAVRDLTLGVRDLPGLMEQNLVSLAAPSVRRVEVTDGDLREEYLMREPPESAEDIRRLRAYVVDDPLFRGGLVTEDERAALVFADFWPGTPKDEIAEGVYALLERYRSPAYDLHATGEPLFVAAGNEYVRTVPLYLGAAVLVMMLVLLASFRTWQGMLLPLLTGVLGTVCGLGLMAASGVPLGLWNQSVPTLVIIVGAGHSAQMLKRYYEERATAPDNRHAVYQSLVRIAPVMLAAGATAAIGFGSMALFGMPGIADFGLSAAYGIGSAVVLELSFMPALRTAIGAGERISASHAEGALGRLGRALARPRFRWLVLAAATVLCAAAAAGVPHIRPGGASREYLPVGHRATIDFEAITAHFPGIVTMTVLLEGPPGAATSPAALAALDRLERALAADPNVARTASLAGLVKKLNAVFTPEHRFELPADPALTAQLLFLGRGPAFERYVDRADTRTVLWAYLRSDAPGEVKRVVELARREASALALPPGAALRVAGGHGPMELAVEERVTRGKILNVAVLLAVIYLLSSLVLRSPAAGVFVILPLVLAVALTVGIIGWAGLRFDLISASVVAVGVGIGADYAIYVLYRLREEQAAGATLEEALVRALDTSGRAVLFVALSIALGFTVLSFSAYRAFQLAGLLTPAAMLASCAAALTVMPAALLAVRPAFIRARPRPQSLDNPPPARALAG